MSRFLTRLPAILLLSFGPLAVGSTLEFLDQGLGWNSHSGPARIWGLVAAVAVGVAGLWLLPIGRRYRALLTLPYLAVIPFAAGVIALPVLCGWYGVCR